MDEFLGFVVICIQTSTFFFLRGVGLEAASSFKISETFSTFAWYRNPTTEDVHVIKNNQKNLCNILNDKFYILQTSPLVNILLKDKWIHFAYLELKYGEFTHITLIFCNNIGIMSGILAGRRVLSSFSQCSFKICKNSIFDLASCIPSWNTKFDINTVVSRYYSCNDSVTNTSPAIPKLDSCLHLHIKLIIQANHTLAHIIPTHTMSCYNKWLLLVLYHPCSAIKDSKTVIILHKRI